MSDCSRIKPFLALNSGGELSHREQDCIAAHLVSCPSCRSEDTEFSELRALTRTMTPSGERLSERTRLRIARQAATRVTRGPLWQRWLHAIPSRPMLRPGLVGVAGLFLLAIAALPVVIKENRPWWDAMDRSTTRAMTIETVAVEGGVTLAWSNGQKDSYTVYKSSDPRLFSPGESHLVRGNIWTDTDSGSSSIVFYKIE